VYAPASLPDGPGAGGAADHGDETGFGLNWTFNVSPISSDNCICNLLSISTSPRTYLSKFSPLEQSINPSLRISMWGHILDIWDLT